MESAVREGKEDERRERQGGKERSAKGRRGEREGRKGV